MVTFVGVGGGRSLENVARHDGGGAVHHALVLIVYGEDGQARLREQVDDHSDGWVKRGWVEDGGGR